MLAANAVTLQVQVEHAAVEHYHLFISYRRGACGDRNIGDLVSNIHFQLMLKAKGLDVFVDKSGIPVGDKWRGKFMTELKGARVAILLITRNTLRRYEKPKVDIVSMFSNLFSSGVQALTDPLVSLSGGGSHLSQSAADSPSAADGVDNVLLEWMIALAMDKTVIPVFVGDSDASTGIVGDLLQQGMLQNLVEPPTRVFDATRAFASAFLASQCDPPVLLPECCASLSSLIKHGILELNGVIVKSVTWDIVPEVIASHIIQSPLLRGMLDELTPKKKILSSEHPLSSAGTPVGEVAKALLPSFNSAQDTGFVQTLYESCFVRTQLWPHATHHKAPRRRTSVGFSLFIAEPAELRGTSVDLLPPQRANSSFFVYLTRGEDPDCRQFVQTWNGVRCTLQLPYIDISCPHISRHHATLLYNRERFELNGIGLCDGHFNDFEDHQQNTALVDCPCNLPNPQGKICSDQGTFVLAFPPAGNDSERRVLMRKPVHTAADTFKIASDGGFVMLDGPGASFMYLMLSNVVIGISDPVAPPPSDHFPPSPPPSPTPCYPSSPSMPRRLPSMLSTTLHSQESLGKGTVNEMELGGWEKMTSCWND